MATIDVKDAGGSTVALEKPLTPGRAAATASRPVALSNEDNAALGALTETAPATDTASSGLNGRLQRIAQRLTSIIALLPTALGAGGGLKVDGSGTALPVSGTVTANAGTNLNTSALALETGGNLATLAGTVTSARAAVNLISGQAGITAGAGAVAASTPRVTLASDDPLLTVIGVKTDTKNTATDGTTNLTQVLKQASYSLQALVTALGGNLDLAAGVVGANTQRVTIGTDDQTAANIAKACASEYDDVAASTTRKLGGTGALGDYLAGITVYPETTSPGEITLQDGNSTAVSIFKGGSNSVSNLVPFYIPFGDSARTSTSAGWTIVTLTNAHVRAHGNFT